MKIKTLEIRLNPEFIQADTEQVSSFLNSVVVKEFSTHFLNGRDNLWSILIAYEEKDNDQNGDSREPIASLLGKRGGSNEELEKRLQLWRKQKAIEERKRPYQIFSNETLKLLVQIKPWNREQLLEIKGIGEKRVNAYGSDILKIIKEN